MAEEGNVKQKEEGTKSETEGLLIDVGEETVNEETIKSSDNKDFITSDPKNKRRDTDCQNCESLKFELTEIKKDKLRLEEQLSILKSKLETSSNELEREVQRRFDLEQRFTEEAKRSSEQIEELIAKSDEDDSKLNKLKKKFDLYSRETSSMIESFTTNREVLTSQLLELRQENDFLLGKFIGKSRDLQNGEINLPQTVEELQFHCLTLNEKFILATLAKEQLEETLIQSQSSNN